MKHLFAIPFSASLLLGFVACRSTTAVDTGFPTDEPVTEFARPALEPFVADGRLPGAISVFESGERSEVCAIGYADVRARRPITLDSHFMQCSQTKGFCGVTIAQLVERGMLRLDDPVARFLPEFKELWIDGGETNGVRTLRRATEQLTVRMCLNHTGGFPFECVVKDRNVRGGGWSGGAPIRQVARVAAAMPLRFEPGKGCGYSNTGIDIAAAVVEAVTGMKWEDYLKANVLDPLGMTETWFWPTDEQLADQIELYSPRKGVPAGYVIEDSWQQRPYNDSHVFASAGAGLWTTANDQLKFYRMLMNLGVGDNGVRILKEETVRDLLATSTRPAEIEKVFGRYSLGLAITGEGDDIWFGHGGAWGTNCMVNWRKRQLRLWVVQQTNGNDWPWGKPLEQAANDFFKADMANASAKEYTGRTVE